MQKIETNESFTVDYQITEEDRKTIPDEFLEYYKYLKELKAIKEFKQKIISVIDKQIVPVMKPQLNKYGEGYTATQIGTLLNKHCSVIGRTVNKLGLRDSLQKIAFDITEDGVSYKYFYTYDIFIKIAKELKLLKEEPSEKMVCDMVNLQEQIYFGYEPNENDEEFIEFFYDTYIVI